MRPNHVALLLSLFSILAVMVDVAGAHGLAGKRFFPATLATEDPFVADELSLPTILHIKRRAEGERPATRETEVSGEFSKRLSPNFGVSLGGAWRLLDPDGGKSVTGFDNLEVALKYQFFRSDAHETLLSLGLSWDVGGTGGRKVEAEKFDTITPALFFGKGFGDLPTALDVMKPVAVTGQFGVAIPTRRISKRLVEGEEEGSLEVEREVNPAVGQWGFSVQYNLQYLQSYVRDIGLPAPLNRMIPIVEVVMETPLDAPAGNGRVTGTINPGIIWFGRYVQLGVEAVIPMNARSGKNVGVIGQIHFYLDDIAPKIFSWTPFHGVLGPTQSR
ncbi:MAG TPA: hypothetical protein VGT02_12375 [Methylomirabilota bacterium]|nr:hypothetical protein [Methylomirabilota bacterium]